MAADAPTPALIIGYGVVRATDGRVLAVHRKAEAGPWAGAWWLPGGVTPLEEDPDDTVPRVMIQDFGMEVAGFEFVETVYGDEPGSDRHTIHNAYRTDQRLDATMAVPLLRDGPFDAYAWLAAEELIARGLPAPQVAALKAVLGAALAAPVQPEDMRDAWDAMSPHYQDYAQIPTDAIHYGGSTPTENELGLLGDLTGKAVLEVGCGGGQNTIAMRKAGAAAATGVDISDEQLRFARGLAEAEGVDVRFRRARAETLEGLENAAFDAVLSAFCYQFVEDIGSAFRAAYRVLRPRGRFAFCLDHPAFAMFGDTVTTSGHHVLEKPYFQRAAEWQWLFPSGYAHRMTAHYHTMEDLFSALRAAGFQVERLLEPEPGRSRGGWRNDPELMRRVPRTVIFAARKPEGRES